MKKGWRIEKKGLSTIIVTLILILLSLVSIGVFWVVVNNLIQGNTENIGLDKLTVSTEILAVGVDNLSNNLTMSIKRNVGAGNMVGMKFVFYNDSDTEIVTENFQLEQLGERQFVFHLSMNISTLSTISIVPIFGSSNGEENVGNVADSYNVKTGKRIETPTTEPPAGCTPTVNPCGSAVCGTAQNGTCGNVNCGSLGGNCSEGYICNPSGQCVSAGCTPAVNPCGTNECGTAINGTCGTINCGNYGGGCQSGYTCVAGTCQVSAPSDLIALYHFDRNTSVGENDTFLYDWSGNGNFCNVTGAVYTSSGITNGAISLDGYGDYINCGNQSVLTPDYITIALWARANEVNNISDRYFVNKPTSYFFDFVRTYAARPHAYIYNETGNGAYTFPIVEPERWIHFAVTYNGSNIRVFLNGTLVGNGLFKGEIRHTPNNLMLGAYGESPTNSRSFNGTIDELRIYNRALSDGEVLSLYNSY